MGIALRRHYWLIIALLIVIGACLAFGSTRIISYNFGKGREPAIRETRYENITYLYDDSVVHEVTIGLSKEDYEEMVRTYRETGEKDFYRASVTIDGVTVPDAGVRLKGNLTLRQTLGGSMDRDMPEPGAATGARAGMPGGDRRMRGFALPGMEFPENWEEMSEEERQKFMEENGMAMRQGEFPRPGGFAPPGMELPENWDEMTEEERQIFMEENGMNMPPGGGMMGGEGNGNNPPLLIKLDAVVPGQTYQGFSEISVRLGSDASLLGEPVAYSIHREAGQIVPETAYAVVQTAELEPSLYVICEHPDEHYVQKHFSGSDGILYKAGNFVGFEYKGDDPSLYAEMFEQKTNVNDDDLAPLIRFMKFVSESSDEEFERDLPNWIDMESFVRMMALDNLLANNDSFVGMGSNYYLYYDKEAERFTMLSWDQNLAMGGMSRMGRPGGDDNGEADEREEERRRIFEEWLEEGGFGEEVDADDQDVPRRAFPGGPGGRGRSNLLKERFFANETFSQMYEAEYDRLKDLIFNEDWALEKSNSLAAVFTAYNAVHTILDQETYNAGLERIASFITERWEEPTVE